MRLFRFLQGSSLTLAVGVFVSTLVAPSTEWSPLLALVVLLAGLPLVAGWILPRLALFELRQNFRSLERRALTAPFAEQLQDMRNLGQAAADLQQEGIATTHSIRLLSIALLLLVACAWIYQDAVAPRSASSRPRVLPAFSEKPSAPPAPNGILAANSASEAPLSSSASPHVELYDSPRSAAPPKKAKELNSLSILRPHTDHQNASGQTPPNTSRRHGIAQQRSSASSRSPSRSTSSLPRPTIAAGPFRSELR